MQAFEQIQRSGFLVRAQTGVYFRDVDRTAGQEVPLLQEFFEQFIPFPFAVDGVDSDAGVEQERGHVNGQLFF